MRLISGDNTVLVSETDKQYIHESEKRGAFPPFSDEITTLSITKYPTIYTHRAIRHYYECRENGGDEYGKDKCFETLYSEKVDRNSSIPSVRHGVYITCSNLFPKTRNSPENLLCL